MQGMQSKHPPTSTGSGNIGLISNRMDGPMLWRIIASVTECHHTMRMGEWEGKGPSQHSGGRGIPFASSPQPDSLLRTCMQNKVYVPPFRLALWEWHQCGRWELWELMTSAPCPWDSLCNLGVVGFVVVADVWLIGCGVWGGRFCFVFSTLPFLLSFVSLVTGRSTYEVQLSSSTPWSAP